MTPTTLTPTGTNTTEKAVMTTESTHNAIPVKPRVGQALPERRPVSFLRTVQVELRKMVDTLAGRWLIIVTVAIAVAIMGLYLWLGEEGPLPAVELFSLVVMPFSILLPVIGVMAATAEWSQRAGLVTFTLEPRRWRVIAARLIAGTILGLGVVVVTLAMAYVIGGAADLFGREVTYDFEGWRILGLIVLLLLTVVQGIAFGFLFLNTPAAIVVILAMPMVWQIGSAMSERVASWGKWLELSQASQVLGTLPDGTGRQWAQLATAIAVSILLPLAIGSLRVIRGEVK